MKLKLDENLGEHGREILSRAGHDVATVASQSLEKAEDAYLIERCRRERRALVSLDLDLRIRCISSRAVILASRCCNCRANLRASVC